jgi:Skp family chaperone for outer membrane proteins
MSDDEDVQISDSEEARACISRLVKAIEGWATKESNKNELEVTAFAAALASGIISFHEFTSKDCRGSQQLIGAISRAKQHIDKEFKKFDGEIDKMHVKFAQEMEELDLKIIRDRKEFKHYLVSLIYAEEYNKLRKKVSNIFETLDAKARYEDTPSS